MQRAVRMRSVSASMASLLQRQSTAGTLGRGMCSASTAGGAGSPPQQPLAGVNVVEMYVPPRALHVSCTRVLRSYLHPCGCVLLLPFVLSLLLPQRRASTSPLRRNDPAGFWCQCCAGGSALLPQHRLLAPVRCARMRMHGGACGCMYEMMCLRTCSWADCASYRSVLLGTGFAAGSEVSPSTSNLHRAWSC